MTWWKRLRRWAFGCDEHDWQLLRVTHGWYVKPFPGPFTIGMWKCSKCGRHRTSEQDGYWTKEELI